MSIPTYSNPCLAPASNTSVYLIGVSDTSQGRLEVNTIDLSNIASPKLTSTIFNSNPYQWSNTAPKFCSHYPAYQAPKNALDTQGAIHIQQFGIGWTNDANVYPVNGKFDPPSGFDDVAYVNPRLFATVGNAGANGFVLAMTNTTDYWVGLRSNATDSFSTLYDFDLKVIPSSRPFLAVGTYTSTTKTPAHGNAIVFDTARSGTIYTATGYDTPDYQVKGPTLILSAPQLVSMKNVVLTNDAIPVSSSSVAYILDKAPDSSTTIYYINPSQSAVLQQVVVTGKAPAFISSMVATATPTQIVLYSIQSGGPRFSVFDFATKTWVNPNIVTPGDPSTGGGSLNGGLDVSGSKTPLGAIVGGAVGALILIALAVFLVIRHRRRRASSSSSSSSHSKEENGKTDLASSTSSSNAAAQDFKKDAITIDAPRPLLPPSTVTYPLPPQTVTYPLPPRSSTPRDPQLSPTDSYCPPPSPSSLNSALRRNPQSPMWQSLAFDFIPKTPPGPELHYPDNDDNIITNSNHNNDSNGYHDSFANSNNTVVYSSFGGASRDISSPVTVVTSRELNSDDYSSYKQRPFTPSSPPVSTSEISYHHHQQQYTPAGTPQLYHRNQEHLQSPELNYSSPLVSTATHAYSDVSGMTVEVDQNFIVPPSALPSSRPPSPHGQ